MTWDKTFDRLKQDLGRKPTLNEVQAELLEVKKLCTICLLEKPLNEFDGEFCKRCRREAKIAGVNISEI